MKAAEITVLSPALGSSFEKNPKPLNEAVCPDFVGLFSGGDDEPMVFHRGPPLSISGPLLSGPGGVSSFLVSGLIALGLVS